MKTSYSILMILIWTLKMPDPARTACGEGTLACHTSEASADTPKLCDISQHYMLSDDKKSCEQKKVEGCELAAYDDQTQPCLLCEAGLVFDAEKNNCVAVAEDKKVELCQRYKAADSTCLTCNDDHYLNNAEGKCAPVDTKVENCASYSDKDTCATCKVNFYLDDKKCVAVPEVENCQSVTDRQCDVCETDYVLNRGWNVLPTVNESILVSLQNSNLSDRIMTTTNAQSVCQKKDSLNCVEFETFNTCKSCSTDYFVNADKACERNPEPSILNCAKYSDNKTCSECKVNFYVKGNPTTCEAITTVENCKLYETSDDKCKECTDTHFLNKVANTCGERTRKTIDKCMTLDLEADKCKKCDEGFTQTTPNAHKCLADVPDCKVSGLVAANDSGTKHTCNDCKDDTFYIDADGLCKKRDVDNCDSYTGTTNSCATCKTDFWLDGQQCKQVTIQFCSKFVTNKNECEDCNTGYEKQNPTTCKKNEVTGCLTYEKNTNKCTACEGDMYVDSDICKTPNVANCVVHESKQEKCKFCEAGYYLHSDFSCKVQELANCVVHTTNKNECESCSLGYYLNGTTCAEITASDCATYHATKNECATCASGYYLNGTTCTALPTNTGCIDFNSGTNVCKTCEAGKYLDTQDNNQCKTLPSNGCIEFTPNTNECTKCSVKHYKSNADPSIPCVVRDKDNCKVYDGDTNDCSECGPGYVLTAKSCVKGTKDNCAEFVTGEDKCAKCIQGYFPDSGTGECGQVTNVPNCEKYKTDVDKCEECKSGMFTADGSACAAKNITNCIKYTDDNDAQKCALCDKSKKLKVSSDASQCEAITNSANCVASIGDAQDKCEECEPTKYLENGVCTGTFDPTNLDINCTGHKATDTKTNKCTSCADDYTLVQYEAELAALTQAEMDALNCLQLGSDGTCAQCKDWFKLEENGTCTEFTSSKWLAMCKRKKKGVTTPLTVGSECEICANPASCFNDNGTCTSREFYSVLEGCDEFHTDKKECKSCEKDKYPETLQYQFSCQNDSTLNTSGVEDNCQVYVANNHCYACNQGYKKNPNDSKLCVQIQTNHKVDRAYGFDMAPIPSIEKTTDVVTNCLLYAQKTETDIECVKCEDGFVGIVTYDTGVDVDNDTILTVFAKENFTGKMDFVNTFSKCVPDANAYKLADNSKHVNDGDCVVGYQDANAADGYACLRCVSSKIGKINIVPNDHNQVQLSPPKIAVTDCTDIVTTSDYPGRLYHFMAMNMRWENIALKQNTHLPFDSCLDKDTPTNRSSTHQLLYAYIQDPAKGHLNFSAQNNTDSSKFNTAYCVQNSNVTTVAGCAFYLLKSEPGAAYDFATQDFSSHSVCGGCLPGYYPSFNGNNYDISLCNQVTQANISSGANSQTWMNSVQTPKFGGHLVNNSASLVVPNYYSLPIESEGKDNCLLIDPSSNYSCIYCKPGFTPYKGECVMNIGGSDKCLYIMGRIDVKLETDDAKKQIQQFQYLIVHRLIFSDPNYEGSTTDICNSCEGAMSPLRTTTLSFDYCKTKAKPGDVPANCDQVDATDQTKCVKCTDGNTLNTSTGACDANIANCLETSDGSTCSKCKTGRIWDTSSCVEHFCKEWDPEDDTMCLLCEDNHRIGSSNKKICKSSTTSFCTTYSPKYQACVKRSGENKIDVMYKQTDANGTIQTENFSNLDFNKANNGFKNINSDYGYILQEVDYTTMTWKEPVYTPIMTAEYKARSFQKQAGQNPASAFCVYIGNSISQDCSESLGYLCKKCNPGMYISSTGNSCFSDSVLDECEFSFYSSNGEVLCKQCTDNFYLSGGANAPYTCKSYSRQNSGPSACATSKIDADECLTCKDGDYLDTSDSNKCKTNNATNCAVKSKTADECESCPVGYYKKPDGNCDKFTAINCETVKDGEDKCEQCLIGYKKDNAGACVKATNTTCMTWHATEDKCGSCSVLFNLSDSGATDGQCVAKTASLCETFNASDDKCETCKIGYNKGAKDCTAKTAKRCAAFDSSLDQCASCVAVAFKNGNNCDQRKASNCKTFVTADDDQCDACTDPTYKNGNTCDRPTEKRCKKTKGTTDQCETCLSGWNVTQAFACEVDSSNLCLTTNQNNSDCLSCAQGRYLLGTACEQNSATDCAEGKKSTTENKCTECADNFYMDSGDSDKCKSNTADNCAEKSKSKNECVSCIDKFYKDSGDNNKCKSNTAPNCATWHKTSLECLTCAENTLEGSDQGKKTCSIYQTPDCLTFSNVKDECATCTKNTHFRQNNGSKFVCTARNVNNCKDFNENEDKCTQCDQKTYLNDGKCENVSEVKHCKTYSVTLDQCSVCDDGYYKSASKNECWLYPDGIEGCVGYTSRTTCIKCDDKSFLSGGKCETVTTAVTDCDEYLSADKCKTCKQGKMLVENECKTITAQNCKEYKDKDTCSSCMDPYVFNTGSSKCESNGISGCTKAVYNSTGNTCSTCENGKVLSDDKKKCESPTKAIANCSVYLTQTKCGTCETSYILSKDGAKCDEIKTLAGANCAVASVQSEWMCDVCRLGYMKDSEGKCKKTELDFCLVPTEDLKKCQLCAPGSYMNKEAACISPEVTPISVDVRLVWSAVLFVALWVL